MTRQNAGQEYSMRYGDQYPAGASNDRYIFYRRGSYLDTYGTVEGSPGDVYEPDERLALIPSSRSVPRGFQVEHQAVSDFFIGDSGITDDIAAQFTGQWPAQKQTLQATAQAAFNAQIDVIGGARQQ